MDATSHKHTQHLIACPSCDELHDISAMDYGHKARCVSCNEVLSVSYKDPFSRAAAYSIAGLICFIMSCSFPFMSFKAKGLESIMTLPQTIAQIYNDGMWHLAVLVAAFILVLPAVILVLVGILGISLAAGWRNYWAKGIAKLIFHLKTWCMVEVFFFGVLVSLVKITHMATIILGIAFWSYAAFSILLILAITRLDTYFTWNRLEELQP